MAPSFTDKSRAGRRAGSGLIAEDYPGSARWLFTVFFSVRRIVTVLELVGGAFSVRKESMLVCR